MAKILITGTARFIGFHLAKRLHSTKSEVIDNLNSCYDSSLKHDRLEELRIKCQGLKKGIQCVE